MLTVCFIFIFYFFVVKKQKHTWKSVRNKKGAKNEDTIEIPKQVVHKSVSSSQRNDKEPSSLRTRMLERLSVARFR